jgi:hypothetical protein
LNGIVVRICTLTLVLGLRPQTNRRRINKFTLMNAKGRHLHIAHQYVW